MSRKISPAALSFIALALVWGSSFLFIKIGLDGLSPGQVAFGRITLGALTLIVIMSVTRRRWPRSLRVWLHMVVVAAALCAIPFSLFAWAETIVPSAVASIANATTPIMTLLLMPLIMPSDKLSRANVNGLIIGVLGVVVLIGPWRILGSTDAVPLSGVLACIGATVCYGIGGLYMRRFLAHTEFDSITLASVQMTMAMVLMLLAAPFTASGPVALSVPIVLAMLALGVFGSGIAYIWNTSLLRAWGAPRASSVTYLTPLVGVSFGVLFLGESLHWNEPVGGVIVILGILASQGVRKRSVVRA